MVYDYYRALDCDCPELPEDGRVWNLASGFVDCAGVKSANGRTEEGRCYYQDSISSISEESLALPTDLNLDPDEFQGLPRCWFSLTVHFTLQTPWYSEDDRGFHVLDNPVRKDRVFGVPFMAAASWKGLLRWACRMEAGLLAHLEQNDNALRGWQDPAWIQHLFGNDKGEREGFERGALAFRPTWFDKVGFEVINPHDRKRRAGTQPIVYEVVPPCSKGKFRLLYAPRPSASEPEGTFEKLFGAIEKLLTVYGISAKRTAGWGLTAVSTWALTGVGGEKNDATSAKDAHQQLVDIRLFKGTP